MKRTTVWACAAVAVYIGSAPQGFAATVDFDTLTPGTTFGHPDDAAGDLVLTEDGIAIRVETFFTIAGYEYFNTATALSHEGDDIYLCLNNISMWFDFTGLEFPVTSVMVEYWYSGGENNFAVNQEHISYDTVHTLWSFAGGLPVDVAPGVTATVDEDPITGNGIITLDGSITNFLIGGQELCIDNIIAVPEPASLVLFAFGAWALIRRRTTLP
jgi:hypothetical protein